MTETTVRTALVTGAANGIGRGIAISLAAAGHQVIAVDADRAALDMLCADQGKLIGLVGNVADEEFWSSGLGAVTERVGAIEILINNAGISPKRDGRKVMGAAMELAEWQKVLDVNLTGVFLGIRAVADGMSQGGWGRIVNMSSMAGRTRARVAGVHYGATKAGVLGLTRTFAGELGPRGITVNAVAPGRIQTAMMGDGNSATDIAMLTDTPTGRFGTPMDISAAVAFLVSDSAGFVNGATIDVNGGALMI